VLHEEHWQNLANTTEPSMCGGDAPFWQNKWSNLVIWHKTALPPKTDGSIVFARWRQCALPCGHIGASWWIRLNLCFLRPIRVHNPNGNSIGSAVSAQLTAESPYRPSEQERTRSKFCQNWVFDCIMLYMSTSTREKSPLEGADKRSPKNDIALG